MLFFAAITLAAGVDGAAALRHASALAALGPHPWGSPRARAAAEYVVAEFRGAGLGEVRLQEFESHGLRGANAIGILRAPGPEFVVVGAHHDSAPGAPGAYDDGGGVGVLIESARVLARARSRPRTLVFVSFDGEEAWSTGKTTTAGSRAYVRSLGGDARHLTGALAIEMCGWQGGTPVLHPIAYSDPLRPRAYAITPGWLMRAALDGAREASAPFGVGDPWISWLYQPAVRTMRARLYGDDLAFLQAGLPATFASDSSFTAFYPWYHQAADTPDKLDARALARMGDAVVGAVQGIARAERGPAADRAWFAAFARVIGPWPMLAVGTALLAAALFRSITGGRAVWGLLFVATAATFAWRHPVVALWILAGPALAVALRSRLLAIAGALPLLALVGLAAAAWARGMVSGLWLEAGEIAAGAAALVLSGAARGRADKARPRRRAPAPRRRGLPPR